MRIAIGTWVRVFASDGSDAVYNGRRGIVCKPTPELMAASVRGQLANSPDDYVAVHFEPRSKRERKHGSPMALILPANVKETDKPEPKGMPMPKEWHDAMEKAKLLKPTRGVSK